MACCPWIRPTRTPPQLVLAHRTGGLATPSGYATEVGRVLGLLGQGDLTSFGELCWDELLNRNLVKIACADVSFLDLHQGCASEPLKPLAIPSMPSAYSTTVTRVAL
jgi:hypothetical protein